MAGLASCDMLHPNIRSSGDMMARDAPSIIMPKVSHAGVSYVVLRILAGSAASVGVGARFKLTSSVGI
jgi:hypothetical protein